MKASLFTGFLPLMTNTHTHLNMQMSNAFLCSFLEANTLADPLGSLDVRWLRASRASNFSKGSPGQRLPRRFEEWSIENGNAQVRQLQQERRQLLQRLGDLEDSEKRLKQIAEEAEEQLASERPG